MAPAVLNGDPATGPHPWCPYSDTWNRDGVLW